MDIKPGKCYLCGVDLFDQTHYRCWRCNKGKQCADCEKALGKHNVVYRCDRYGICEKALRCRGMTTKGKPCRMYLDVNQLYYCQHHNFH